ncbi:MAG: ribonuclease HI [Cyanobacteria bacterium REEB65]|nr:ribonuclease HI [Cyanobacteria bacterium REEB65]
MTFEGYCDAACSGNPGPGAAAAVLVARDGARVVSEKELVSEVEPQTTNQREELKGAILILEALTRPVAISVTSDSRYLVDGMTKWLPNWERKGWVTAKGEAVANQDLWRRLHELAGRHRVQWHWVKGHSGHAYNERCDRLAVAAVEAFKRQGGAHG